MGDTFMPASFLFGDGFDSIATADVNPRVVFDASGLVAYDVNGNVLFRMDASTGAVTLTAIILALGGSTFPAGGITGQLTDAQLQQIAAAKVSGQLTDAQLAAISSAKLIGQIVNGQIAANAITATEIAANAVNTSELAALAVTTAKISAGAITANELAAASVVAGKIAAGTVTATELSAAAVTAAKIAAGAIDAMIITGATVRTSAANPKTQLDSTGLAAIDSTGVNGVKVDATAGVTFRTNASALRAISWKDSGGALVAEIDATDNTTFPSVVISTFGDPTHGSLAQLAANNDAATGGGLAAITALSFDSLSRQSVKAQASTSLVSHTRKILDSAGDSDFGLISITDTGVITLNGGVAVAANLTWDEVFSHNLQKDGIGVSPDFATAIYVGGGNAATQFFCAFLVARSTTTITLRFRLVNGGTLAAGATGRFFVLTAGN